MSKHTMRLARGIVAAMVVSVFVSGCNSGPRILRQRHDENSCYPPGSDEWWAEKAMLPVGTRQKVFHGKVYPVQPRPTGEHQQFSHIYHAAHYWPWPYVCQDRQHVRSVWHTMETNGWTEATTLYDYHFDVETDRLTTPGRNHLLWIMETIPESKRVAYVDTTTDPIVNQVRLENVRVTATEFAVNSTVPPISMRNARPTGRPASEVEAIRKQEISTMPVPRLDAAPQ